MSASLESRDQRGEGVRVESGGHEDLTTTLELNREARVSAARCGRARRDLNPNERRNLRCGLPRGGGRPQATPPRVYGLVRNAKTRSESRDCKALLLRGIEDGGVPSGELSALGGARRDEV